MTLMVWRDEYSVGVDAIDDDHKLLVSLINQLHDAQETAQAHELVGSILNVLLEYTVGHFALEERLMERGGYPQLEQHRAEHRRLTARIDEMKVLYDSGEYAVVEVEMLRFFSQWLANHITRVDTRFRPWVEPLGADDSQDLATWPGRLKSGAAPA